MRFDIAKTIYRDGLLWQALRSTKAMNHEYNSGYTSTGCYILPWADAGDAESMAMYAASDMRAGSRCDYSLL